MASGGLTYSRLIAWLKVILPLAALVLLSTLFLFSRNIGGSTDEIPFAEEELEQKAREQRLSAPFFSGKTSNGNLVAFTAESARPDADALGRAIATKMEARIDHPNGQYLTFASDRAMIDNTSNAVTLQGQVNIQSSQGYEITTTELVTAMRETRAHSTGKIRGTGPGGQVEAGMLQILPDEKKGDTYLIFSQGVKMIVNPAGSNEVSRDTD
nr:LPS export ABC transporter periplasmic protein LptC [uncultured Shimia sp.]